MSGNGNNGMDELAILVESFVEEITPFLTGIRRGVAGIFAMPRDAQAITAARGSLGTISASSGVLDLPAARQLGELAQLLDEAFQSAERGGVPDDSHEPMMAMVDHLEDQLNGLLTGDDRGRERLDNAYRLLEQVLQTVEKAETAPEPTFDIALDDLLLTLQPVASPPVAPEPVSAPVEEVVEPEPIQTTELVLLSDAEIAPIEWGQKEAKLWEKRGWDESQAAYGNTGWVFLDDDDETHQANGEGQDTMVVAAVPVAAEVPALSVEAAPEVAVDEVIDAPAPLVAGAEDTAIEVVEAQLTGDGVVQATSGSSELLDAAVEPPAGAAEPPVFAATLEGTDNVIATAPAESATGSLSIDANGLEEAVLLALSPDELATYLELAPSEQRTFIEARLGEMSEFAAELGLATPAHPATGDLSDLLASLPTTDNLSAARVVDTATLHSGTASLIGQDGEDELLAPPKRRARRNRRAMPMLDAPVVDAGADEVAEESPPSVAADHVAPSDEVDQDSALAAEVAQVDDLLLTEYRSTDHGTGALVADLHLSDALEAAEQARLERRESDQLLLGTDRLLLHAADELGDLANDRGELDGDAGESFLDALLEEDGPAALNRPQLADAADQLFDDADEGELDPAYGAMPDVSPEIEAAFAQLSDADMATFLSLDGDAAMSFLQAKADGATVDAATDAPLAVDSVATRESDTFAAELPEVSGSGIDQEILEVFLLEMQELLSEWERMAAQLRARPTDGAQLADLRRVAHTVKGAARMVGFHELGTVGWRVEEVLDQLDEHDLAATTPVLDFIDRSYVLVQRLAADTSVDPATFADEDAELDRLHAKLTGAITAGEFVAPRLVEGEDRLVDAAMADAESDRDEGTDEEIDDELLDVFVQEADEHLAAFNRTLVALDRNPADSSQVLEAKRVVHTLKGASAALGYPVTAALCHRVEDLFEQLDGSGRAPSREMMTLFFESAETLEALMAGITAGRGEDASRGVALHARYDAFLKHGKLGGEDTIVGQAPVAGAEEAPRIPEASVAPRSVRVDIGHLDNLLNLVGELVINRTSQEQHLERLGHTLSELLLSVDRLRRVGFQLESRYEVAELLRGEQRRPGAPADPAGAGGGRLRLLSPQTGPEGEEEEFDALEMDRYTELHRISRELVEIAADINAAGTELDGLYDNFDQSLSRQSRIATDLQDRMMEVRLVPVSTIAARLYRAVRGVAQRRSRQVELVIEGEAVEIDKVLLEEITDPLLHLVRNAADHGIESPQERIASGKPASGTVRLSAAREGNEAVIRVTDDGAGIDLDRVLEKALARGVIRRRDGLTREQILDLIFLPGFSTSATISDISGRGVGLDVVRTNVRRLKGTIDVESTPGEGTTFIIRLPIMLAVTRALLIRSGSQTFAIPLPVVEQVAFFRKEQVSSVGGGDLLDLGGETYPVVYLSRALGLTDTSEVLSNGARALVVGNADRRIALVVDELVGQQEIVVKQLGRHLQSVAGVAGATILGNGQVVLILNVLDLIGDRRAVRSSSRSADIMPQPQPVRPVGAARGAEGPRLAMIVDDSLSVRRVLTRTLERDGWQVLGAKDGVEALEMLAWATPRVIVLDIEMPRMDGYELTSLIRNHPDHHDLPIAMLTSRAGEKHRRKAFDLGVTSYLVKPFEETELLRTVRELSMTARQGDRNAG